MNKIIPIEAQADFSRLDRFYQENEQETWLARRFAQFAKSTERVLQPAFPRYLQIETSNICNHACTFCAYTTMTRTKQLMDPQLFERIVREAYTLGAREVGLFSGAEPLTCKNLDQYVRTCHTIGYEYIYISTNGVLGGPDRFRGLLDAGLSSIKFSINGGTRDAYLRAHGKDHFDRAVENVRFTNAYRKTLGRPTFLAISFVEHPGVNDGTYDALKALLGSEVDEMVFYQAANQSGQMPHLPAPAYRDCDLPFNKIHVSVEGYLRACCNDYENLLALKDLNGTSLDAAWASEAFVSLRRRHLDDDLAGTLCGSCIRNSKVKAAPLDPALSAVKAEG